MITASALARVKRSARPPMGIFFAEHSFLTEVVARAAPSAVLAILDDLPAFIRLNPLVFTVEPVVGEAARYLVTDRLRFLGFAFAVRYEVRFTRVPDGLDTEVRAAPATRVFNELRVVPEGAGTRMREKVRMRAPRPLAAYGASVARKAHRELLDRLAERSEAG